MLGDDDDDDDECPSRRLINNLADISDKAIPAKKERQEKWTPYQYHGSAHGINEMEYHVS